MCFCANLWLEVTAKFSGNLQWYRRQAKKFYWIFRRWTIRHNPLIVHPDPKGPAEGKDKVIKILF